MTQVLYRKYRPQNLHDIVGQKHIVQALKNTFKQDLFAQAYFFTGPKGTGKTSTARILAKAANCTTDGAEKPCGKCENCVEISEGRSLDLIEIDAASNRGIDEIRELKDKINFLPIKSTYKVYIIDEVHMLTAEAFNALLKTLEEPPKHVLFILCTTEPQKVPQTVISRCQRFDFRRASLADIVAKLAHDSEQEKIKVDEDVLMLIAKNSSGGFRDAETILDQVITYARGEKKKEVDKEMAYEIIGSSDMESIKKLVDYLSERNIKDSILYINALLDGGYNISQLTKGIIEYLRFLMLIKNGAGEDLIEVTKEQYKDMCEQAKAYDHALLIRTIERFGEAEYALKYAQIPQLPLEMAIVDSIFSVPEARIETAKKEDGGSNPKTEITKNASQKEHDVRNVVEDEKSAPKKETAEKQAEVKPLAKKPETVSEEKEPEEAPAVDKGAPIVAIEKVREKWSEILKTLKPYNHSVEAFLKAARPKAVEGKYLIVEFFYPFHKERIENKKHRDLVESVIEKVMGVPVHIKCILSKKEEKTEEIMKAAQEIFNGKLVFEQEAQKS